MTYSTVIVTINDNWVMNLSTYNELSTSSGWKVFKANLTANKLCFDSKYNINNMLFYGFLGPCIDNITLVKYSNTTSTVIFPSTNIANSTSVINPIITNNSLIIN